jgi:hypothetical protein
VRHRICRPIPTWRGSWISGPAAAGAQAPKFNAECAATPKTFSHIFVDEFQDTDPLQAAIPVLLASSDPVESDWPKVSLRQEAVL